MAGHTGPRRLRATAAAFVITTASMTMVGCGSDVVDDGVEQNIQEGVDDAEKEVENATEGAESTG